MASPTYNPREFEPKWQKEWKKARLFNVTEDSKKKKYYLLEMLPYPSGRLHIGHVRNYSIGDVAARYKMMQGYNVLHPIGWDAFGLPAENAAIQHGVHPAPWTHDNIVHMRDQLERLGLSYDWDREITTCDPEYYKWEQLIFVRMYKKGMVTRKTSQVNWCNGCQTVLANEQVEKGKCWRCDSVVEMKSMTQWYFRTPVYAEELLKDIDTLTGWPERVRVMQREWIGKSEGAMIDFPVENSSEKIRVFTTRPDTLFGVTFVSLAFDHPLVKKLSRGTKQEKAVNAFLERTSHIDHQHRLADEYEKEGVFLGASCRHPFTSESIPIYAANFVVMEYGTGAVMAVPAHDERDFEFAKKYQLPVKVVVNPQGEKLDASEMTQAFTGEGVLVDSNPYSGLSSRDAIQKISADLKAQGKGEPTVTYRLKDWCLSRQRYWGAPIPIIYCDRCGTVPVPEEDLPVTLPEKVEFTGTGGSPLAKVASFVETQCPTCKAKARRETDTMDTFVESSWYFFRYTSPHFSKGPFDPKCVRYWFPIDQYIGGIEHAVGHLIYCRYYTKVLRDLGMLSLDEPVVNLLTQGMVVKNGVKMSKSKGNVVEPDVIIEKYSIDAARLFVLFAAPPEKDLEWSDRGVEGLHRFLKRVWKFVHEWKAEGGKGTHPELERWRHRTIQRVTDDIERWHYNTAISAIMEYVNFLHDAGIKKVDKMTMETLLLVLSPFAPHTTEELWRVVGNKDFLIRDAWPNFDPEKFTSESMHVVVQVNGKLRDKIELPQDTADEKVKQAALASEKVSRFLDGARPQRVIYVPKKLVNIVV